MFDYAETINLDQPVIGFVGASSIIVDTANLLEAVIDLSSGLNVIVLI
jgi:hypothetical protein